jgi:predicted transcriptional regulator YheO
MFGPSCETLVHDMGVPSHPILSIYNGHVSGRSVGSTQDILGTSRELDQEATVTDFVNLLATTPNGQQIKSSTFHMIGEDYNLALGINFDFTSLAFATRTLNGLVSAGDELKKAMWQKCDDRLDELLESCLEVIGKPATALNKNERMRVISMLNERDAFSYRKSVPFVSQRLGVSRYTVYKYLSELNEAEEANET